MHLVDRYGEAIEYDLHEHFRVDLLDFFRGRYSWRKFLALVNRLPSWSRFREAQSDDEEWAEWVLSLPESVRKRVSAPALSQWTPEVAVLTDVADYLKEVIRVTVAAAGGKPPSVRPEPRPRTAVHRLERRREMGNLDDLAAEVEAAQARWEATRG